jgi:hypothetical protein
MVDDASTDESVPFVQAHYPEVTRRPAIAEQRAGSRLQCGRRPRRATCWSCSTTTRRRAGLAGRAGRGCRCPPGRRRLRQQDAALRPPRHAAQCGRRDGRRRHSAQPRRLAARRRPVRRPTRWCSAGAAAASPIAGPRGSRPAASTTRLFMYLEDVDLAWRLQLLGWTAVFVPAARLYHHLSATGGGTLASYYTGRNTIWVIAKDMPGPLLRRHFGKIARRAVAHHARRAGKMRHQLRCARPDHSRSLRRHDRQRQDRSVRRADGRSRA